jgi:hypothetical protein
MAVPNLSKINHQVPKEIAAQLGDEADAYSVDEFCTRHRISRAFLYLMWRDGEGPAYMQVRGKRLIPKEAAAEWRTNNTRKPEVAG